MARNMELFFFFFPGAGAKTPVLTDGCKRTKRVKNSGFNCISLYILSVKFISFALLSEMRKKHEDEYFQEGVPLEAGPLLLSKHV